MILKSEKGSVTVYTLVVMVILTTLAIGFFVSSSNKQQTQLEALEQVKNIYTNGETATQAYQKYIGGEVIPIYNQAQLKKIGSNEIIYIDGKNYTFGTGKTYVLQKDINFVGDFSSIQTLIDNKSITLEKQNFRIIMEDEEIDANTTNETNTEVN